MTDFPSFQDQLDDFSEQVFVGRAEQIRLFENTLTAQRPPFLIMNVFGQGGVGKSTLLEQYERRAKDLHLFISVTNEDQASIVSVVKRFADQLGEQGAPCDSFTSRYKKYMELKGMVEADPQAPTGFLSFAVRSVTKVGLKMVRRVPVAGEISEVLLNDNAIDALAEQADIYANYVAQKFAKKDEKELLLETDRELTGCFLDDINKIMQSRKIVLVFDTYEKTSNFLDEWLRDLLKGEYGKFSGNILFVIAGRTPLLDTDQNWTRFSKATHRVELSHFTIEEARDYLQRSGVNDPEQVEHLIELSGCLPVLLALLASAPRGVPTQVYSNAVERFLQGTASDQRESALVASVPRLFNQDILVVIINPENAKASFDFLSRTPFVRASPSGWAYHEVVRTMMLRYFHNRSAALCRELHAKLVEYYQVQAGKLDLPKERQRENPRWHSYEMEWLYHLLSISVQNGLKQVITSFLDDQHMHDPHRLSSYAELLSQVAGENDESELELWSKHMSNLCTKIQDMKPAQLQDARLAATAFCELSSLDPRQQALAYAMRAEVLLKLEKAELAMADIDRAIHIRPDNDSFFRQRALIRMSLPGRRFVTTEENLEDLQHAIRLQPKEPSNYIYSIAINVSRQNYLAAIDDVDKLISQDPKAEYYNLRGILRLGNKDYFGAISDFDQAIDLDPGASDYSYYLNRARANKESGNLPKALEDLDFIITKPTTQSSTYVARGQVYAAMGNPDAADTDYNKALELDPENAEAYAQRGIDLPGRYDPINQLSQAISLKPDNGQYYALRSLLYLGKNDLEHAIEDVNQAFQLLPRNPVSYYVRGRIYFQKEDTTKALEDLSTALVLSPAKGEYYLWRGRAYLALKNIELAILDLSKAIEIDPTHDAYYFRSVAYFNLADYPTALLDIDKAIQINPEEADYYDERGLVKLYLNNAADAVADYLKALELGLTGAGTHYNLACAYGRLGNAHRACESLKNAIQLEPSHRQLAMEDHDFDAVRGDEMFQVLMTSTM